MGVAAAMKGVGVRWFLWAEALLALRMCAYLKMLTSVMGAVKSRNVRKLGALSIVRNFDTTVAHGRAAQPQYNA
eukprot:1150353-Pelagomonas_calceolata.AAC.2